MKNIKDILIVLLILLFVLALGTVIGVILDRNFLRPEQIKTETVTDTIFQKADTVFLSIEVPKPYKVTDTAFISLPIDTTALYEAWQDYHRTKQYSLDFSNDTLGTFKVDATVHKNEIAEVKSTIVPVIKIMETTKTEVIDKKKFVQGFVSIGTSVHNFNAQQVTAGVEFVEKFDVSATTIRYNSDFAYTINFGIKFGGK